MGISVTKKKKSRKQGRASQMGGGYGKSAVLRRVVREGPPDKVTWLRDVKELVPDNFILPFHKPFEQQKWESTLVQCFHYFYCTCEITLLFML